MNEKLRLKSWHSHALENIDFDIGFRVHKMSKALNRSGKGSVIPEFFILFFEFFEAF